MNATLENGRHPSHRPKAIDAFRFPQLVHAAIAKEGIVYPIGFSEQTRSAWNFFLAGIRYFLAHDDPQLKSLAANARIAFGDRRVLFAYSTNPDSEEGTISSGVMSFKPASSGEEGSVPVLTVSPAFLDATRDKPVQLLAEIAGNLSLIRDYTGAKTQDRIQDANATAERVVAGFLLNVASETEPNPEKPLYGRARYRHAL